MAVIFSLRFLTVEVWFLSHFSPCVICGGHSGNGTGLSPSTVELHLSGLSGTASHPDMQKISIIGFFFDSRLFWQFEVRRLIFTLCTFV